MFGGKRFRSSRPVTRRTGLSVVVLLLGGLLSSLTPAPPAVAATTPVMANWAASGRMTDQRPAGATMTTLKDGRVIVIGGTTAVGADESPRLLASVEVYDPKTGIWSAGADMPEARASHGAALLPSGKILVAGGLFINCCVASYPPTADIYDPIANTWSPTADMSYGRYWPATAILNGGRVLFAGGYSFDAKSQSTAEAYDETTRSWSAISTMAHPYQGGRANLMKDGRVFMIGGPSSPATSEVFDPVTNLWQDGPAPLSVRPATTPYGGFTVNLLNDGRLLIVGEDSTSDVSLTEFYDPATNSYIAAPSPLSVHAGHTAINLPNGTVLVVGGYLNASSEIFDPVANHWLDAGNMLGTRGSHLAALLADGSVLVATGQGRDTGQMGAVLGYLLTTERSASFGSAAPPALKAADIRFEKASSADPLLQRRISILSAQSSADLGGYDYGWASTADANNPDSDVIAGQIPASGTGYLDYRLTTPNSTWTLFVRSRNTVGIAGQWVRLSVPTPRRPILVALGDSITSGHHRDSSLQGTVCDDPLYGYPATVMRRLQAALPLDWRGGYYANLAHSGFSTDQIEKGGKNACGETVSTAPLFSAEKLLSSNARLVDGVLVPSWDQVVITGGIDNTNWGNVVTQVVSDYADPLRVDAAKCREDVNRWDGWPKGDGSLSQTQVGIRDGVKRITDGLQAAAVSSHISWISYYDIAGTGTSNLRNIEAVPSLCDPAMADATRAMRLNIRAGLPSNVPLLDANLIVGNKNEDLQRFLLSQEITRFGRNDYNLSGWPHPNRTGASLIGSLVSF